MQPRKKTSSSAEKDFGLITEISFDEFRHPRSAKLTSEPNDPPGAMEAAIRAVLESAPAARPVQVAPAQAVIDVSKPLSSYIEAYLSNAFMAVRPDEKTLDSYRAAIALFIDIVGDKPLHALGVNDQNRFEDMIGKIPANRTKIAKTRGMSIDELTALDAPKLSPQSAKNVAMRTNRFLTWSFRREGGKPPFELMGNVRIRAYQCAVKDGPAARVHRRRIENAVRPCNIRERPPAKSLHVLAPPHWPAQRHAHQRNCAAGAC